MELLISGRKALRGFRRVYSVHTVVRQRVSLCVLGDDYAHIASVSCGGGDSSGVCDGVIIGGAEWARIRARAHSRFASLYKCFAFLLTID